MFTSLVLPSRDRCEEGESGSGLGGSRDGESAGGKVARKGSDGKAAEGFRSIQKKEAEGAHPQDYIEANDGKASLLEYATSIRAGAAAALEVASKLSTEHDYALRVLHDPVLKGLYDGGRDECERNLRRLCALDGSAVSSSDYGVDSAHDRKEGEWTRMEGMRFVLQCLESASVSFDRLQRAEELLLECLPGTHASVKATANSSARKRQRALALAAEQKGNLKQLGSLIMQSSGKGRRTPLSLFNEEARHERTKNEGAKTGAMGKEEANEEEQAHQEADTHEPAKMRSSLADESKYIVKRDNFQVFFQPLLQTKKHALDDWAPIDHGELSVETQREWSTLGTAAAKVWKSTTSPLPSASTPPKASPDFQEALWEAIERYVRLVSDFPKGARKDVRNDAGVDNSPQSEHPYRKELEALGLLHEGREDPWGYEILKVMQKKLLRVDKPVEPREDAVIAYVKDEEGLTDLVEKILSNGISEVALDVEYHSQQSYRGYVCLLQLTYVDSFNQHDVVIDPASVPGKAMLKLNEILTNPAILKVLHGCHYDVQWLQKDLGLYLVNVFDTFHASKALQIPGGNSLRNLVDFYCQYQLDKAQQVSDWRVRPLKEEQIKYAGYDTHFLLYIFHCMRNQLLTRNSDHDTVSVFDRQRSVTARGKAQMQQVLQASRTECLQVVSYAPTNLGARCERIVQKHTKMLTVFQHRLLARLLAWRDLKARVCDISTGVIASEMTLLAVALEKPLTFEQLQAAVKVPKVAQRLKDTLPLIRNVDTHTDTELKETFYDPREGSLNLDLGSFSVLRDGEQGFGEGGDRGVNDIDTGLQPSSPSVPASSPADTPVAARPSAATASGQTMRAEGERARAKRLKGEAETVIESELSEMPMAKRLKTGEQPRKGEEESKTGQTPFLALVASLKRSLPPAIQIVPPSPPLLDAETPPLPPVYLRGRFLVRRYGKLFRKRFEICTAQPEVKTEALSTSVRGRMKMETKGAASAAKNDCTSAESATASQSTPKKARQRSAHSVPTHEGNHTSTPEGRRTPSKATHENAQGRSAEPHSSGRRRSQNAEKPKSVKKAGKRSHANTPTPPVEGSKAHLRVPAKRKQR